MQRRAAGALAVQRWNPISAIGDAAKKLAEKALGAIRNMGAAAQSMARSIGSKVVSTAGRLASGIKGQITAAASAILALSLIHI